MPIAMRTARSGGSFPCSFRICAQQAALHPLHHHVELAAFVVAEDLHHARMIEHLADLFLAAEAVEKHRVALHFRMRNLDGHRAARARIRAAEYGCHAAVRNQTVDAVMVELAPAWTGNMLARAACHGRGFFNCSGNTA